MSELMVFAEDASAAEYRRDVVGWVSRRGNYYGDGQQAEMLARLDGATHIRCAECGVAVEKDRHRTVCVNCSDSRAAARWAAMPKRAWDLVTPVWSMAIQEFFDSPDEAEEWTETVADEDPGWTLEKMCLVLCEPVCVRPLDADDLWDSEEDGRAAPRELVEAVEAFNRAVFWLVQRYEPGEYGLDLSGM